MGTVTVEGYEFIPSKKDPTYYTAIAPHNPKIRISLWDCGTWLWRVDVRVKGRWVEVDTDEGLPSLGRAACAAIERVDGIHDYLKRRTASAIESAKWWQQQHEQLEAIRNAIKNP
jgi:hypothetical protein